MGLFIAFATWIILAFAVAGAAKKRGRSFGGYLLLSLLFSPLLGIIVVLLLGETEEKQRSRILNVNLNTNPMMVVQNQFVQTQEIEAELKECPFCAEQIKKNAKLCRFCGKEMPYMVENVEKIAGYIEKTAETQNNDSDEKKWKMIYNIHAATHRVKLLTASNGLSLRKEPDAHSEVFTKISDGTEVQVLEIGEEVVLKDKKAKWCKIRTSDDVIGWCFSGSLVRL